MFEFDFLREFFDLSPRSGLVATFGREVIEKALELAKGQSPEANLMPYIQLVLDANRLGLKVTR